MATTDVSKKRGAAAAEEKSLENEMLIQMTQLFLL